MKKHKILATVIKENSGYSAFATIQKHFIATEGESFEELKSHFIKALNLALKCEGYTYQLSDIQDNYRHIFFLQAIDIKPAQISFQ